MLIGRILWYLMTLLAIGIAGYALMNLAIPQFRSNFIANIFGQAPIASYLHLGFGFIAMLSGPFQLNRYLRNKYLSFHRLQGKVYVFS